MGKVDIFGFKIDSWLLVVLIVGGVLFALSNATISGFLFSTITFEPGGLDPGIPWDVTSAFINPTLTHQSDLCVAYGPIIVVNKVDSGDSVLLPSYEYFDAGVSTASRVDINGEWYTRYAGLYSGSPPSCNAPGGIILPAEPIKVLNDFRGKRLRIKTVTEQFIDNGNPNDRRWLTDVDDSGLRPVADIAGCTFDLPLGVGRIETQPRVLTPEIIDVYFNDVFKCGVTLDAGEPFSVSFGNLRYNYFFAPLSPTNGNAINFAVFVLDGGCKVDVNEMLVMSTETTTFTHDALSFSDLFSGYCLDVSPTIARLNDEGQVEFANDLRGEVPLALMSGEIVCVGAGCPSGILSITIPRVVKIPQGLTPCPSGQAYDLDSDACVNVTAVLVIVPNSTGGRGGGGGPPLTKETGNKSVVPLEAGETVTTSSGEEATVCVTSADCGVGSVCGIGLVCPNDPDVCQESFICTTKTGEVVVVKKTLFVKVREFVKGNLLIISGVLIILLFYFGFTKSGIRQRRVIVTKIKKVFKR